MPHINIDLFYKIPEYLRGVMEYYPDVSLFKLNQIQYNHLWQQLSASKYLYTNGYEIKPVSWFRHTFESFKGWLGFKNHCHPETINYTLKKLAYYGYTKQFHQPAFTLGNQYSIPPQFIAMVNQNYRNEITSQLQTELIKSYFRIEPHLNIDYTYQMLNPNHRFGESWFKPETVAIIPLLDPQNESLIVELVTLFDKRGISVSFLEKSKYAQIAAQFYLTKAKNVIEPSFLGRLLWDDPRPGYLAQALDFDKDIAKSEPEKFIKYYLGQKDYKNAFNLLSLLDDKKLILELLLSIPEINRVYLIQKDTPIAAILANYYIGKKQYNFAQSLYTDIEFLSPNAAFAIAINDGKYVYAYELFKRLESTSNFAMDERKTLATVFYNQAEKEYITGRTHRETKGWVKAEHHYFRSYIQKKTAHHLNPSNAYLEDLYTHKRLYAKLLIDADIDLNKTEDSDIANIQKAITLLRECSSNKEEEQNYQKAILAKGLMRRVDTLREKISLKRGTEDHSIIDAHRIKHQQEIDTFIKTLDEIIKLLKDTKDKSLLLQLGKAYYLLADVQDYFDINAPDINQNYRLAMDAAPDNPFYIIRVTEVFPNDKNKDTLVNTGLLKLKSMSYSAGDWYHYFVDDRWVKKDKIIHPIKDLHEPSIEAAAKLAQPTGWLSLGF